MTERQWVALMMLSMIAAGLTIARWGVVAESKSPRLRLGAFAAGTVLVLSSGTLGTAYTLIH